MNPTFDEKDAAILSAKQALFDAVSGPRVGDFVQFPDEQEPRRFTHKWSDSLQTTCGPKHPCAGDHSFYLGDGSCDFSGSLDSGIPNSSIIDTGEVRQGRVWFFHHGAAGAQRGVYCSANFRVYAIK